VKQWLTDLRRGLSRRPFDGAPTNRAALLYGLGAIGIVILVVLFTKPTQDSPTQYSTPGGGLFGSSIKTLPTSRHITGTYPTSCTLGMSNGHVVPDHSCTPGAADAEVIVPNGGNPGNIRGTICTPGWTTEARALPTELVGAFTAATNAYNVRGQATLNWLVPLELGGSNDVSNLWVMPVTPADPVQAEKAKVDDTINKAVCAGTIGLAAAQNAEANNWTTATSVLGLEH
jgi:hypothetical protein